jgi:putative endonuclease
MWYTYVIRSQKNGLLYTGMSNDLRKRLWQHNNGKSSYTRNKGPFILIYYEACHDRSDAAAREIYLKTGMGKRFIKSRLKRFLTLTG